MTATYAVIAACVAVIAVGQLLFKIVGARLGPAGLAGLLADRSAALLLVAALLLYGGATLAWVWALRSVALSTAYLFMSASFILVPLMAHFVLGEPLSPRLALGSLLVVAGILIALPR